MIGSLEGRMVGPAFPAKPPVMLLGGSGKLGRAIMARWPGTLPFRRDEIDITDRNRVFAAMERLRPRTVINCAALTDVAYCERNPQEAWKVNVTGVSNVADAAVKYGAYVIHLSSDAAADPVNHYGRTKLESERLVPGLVIRCNFYDQSHWLLKRLVQGSRSRLLSTNVFNPITVSSLLDCMGELARKEYRGVLNLGVRDEVSYYDFGISLCDALGYPTSLIEPCTTVELPYPFPLNTYLDIENLDYVGVRTVTLEEDMRNFKDELEGKTTPGCESAPGR